MHPDIKRLIELQAVDLRLAEVRALVAEFPKRLAQVDVRVAAARQQLTAAKDALITSLKDRKKYELDVEQWKEKARKYRDQSYEVKTNEAYRALQHEIANAEAEMAKAEDRLLERMVAGEEYERQVKAAERTIQEVEAQAKAERQKIEVEQAAAQKEFEAFNAKRQEAVGVISEDLLDHYQRIAKRHHGIALAEVRDETCTLCGVRVRPHVFQELRRASSEEIFHCESCTRILYYTEPHTAAAATAPDAANVSAETRET
jgi:predicted  nucleic acid-binding Zn-ribbon protein